MTVGELRRALQGVPDDRVVIVGDHLTAGEIVEVSDDHDAGDEEPVFLIYIDEKLGESHALVARDRLSR